LIRATICEIIKDGKILLQRKSVGRFGEGKWNGPGGKLDPEESPLQGVIREVKEETGLLILEPELRGEIDFYFGEKTKPDWITFVFLVTQITGEINPSEEGELRWFKIEEIPYNQMWPDDSHWLPPLISRKKVKGTFWYDEAGDTIKRYKLKIN
jgi:mutator protein MutT